MPRYDRPMKGRMAGLLIAIPGALVFGLVHFLQVHGTFAELESGYHRGWFSEPTAYFALSQGLQAASVMPFMGALFVVLGMNTRVAKPPLKQSFDVNVLLGAALAAVVVGVFSQFRVISSAAACGLAVLVFALAGVLWIAERRRAHWRWPGISAAHVLCAIVLTAGLICVILLDAGKEAWPGLMEPPFWVAFAYMIAYSLRLVTLGAGEFRAQCEPPPEVEYVTEKPSVPAAGAVLLTFGLLLGLQAWVSTARERAETLADELADVDLLYASPDDVAAALDGKPYLVTATDSDGNTLLHWAIVLRAHTDAIELLLERGAPVNALGAWGMPLRMALDRQREDVVQMLLARGACQDLYTAAGTGDLALLGEILDEEPGAVNPAGEYARPPLLYAARHGQLESCKLLLSRGADAHALGENGGTALHAGAHGGSVAVARLFLEGGVPLDGRDRSGATALHDAVWSDSADMVEFLLAQGLGPDCVDDDGSTPLHWTAWPDAASAAEALLAAGADVEARDKDGYAPLHKAAEAGSVALIEVLARFDGDLNARAGNGDTPLHVAGMKGQPRAVEALLSLGADPDARDADGFTPLNRAAQWHQAEAVAAFKDHRAETSPD